MKYRYGSNTIFQVKYRFVWVTKYRYKVRRGEVAEWVRELVRIYNRMYRGINRVLSHGNNSMGTALSSLPQSVDIGGVHGRHRRLQSMLLEKPFSGIGYTSELTV